MWKNTTSTAYKTKAMFWITTAAHPEIILKCERLFSSRFWDTFEIHFDFNFRKFEFW